MKRFICIGILLAILESLFAFGQKGETNLFGNTKPTITAKSGSGDSETKDENKDYEDTDITSRKATYQHKYK